MKAFALTQTFRSSAFDRKKGVKRTGPIVEGSSNVTPGMVKTGMSLSSRHSMRRCLKKSRILAMPRDQ